MKAIIEYRDGETEKIEGDNLEVYVGAQNVNIKCDGDYNLISSHAFKKITFPDKAYKPPPKKPNFNNKKNNNNNNQYNYSERERRQ